MSISARLYKFVLVLCLLACSMLAHTQHEDNIPTLSAKTYSLDLKDWKWKFTNADSNVMSAIDYDDSHWHLKSLEMEDNGGDSLPFTGLGWFRLSFSVDSVWVNKPLAMTMTQEGASEIYLDDELLIHYGKIAGRDSSVYYHPREPLPFMIATEGKHVMAVRYAHYHLHKSKVGFRIVIGSAASIYENFNVNNMASSSILVFLLILFFTISFLHFLFFLFYKKNVSNLFFAIFMLCIGGVWTSRLIVFLSPILFSLLMWMPFS